MNIKKILIGVVSIGILSFLAVVPAFADSVSVNFENPPYNTGSISGQDGWSNAVNPTYDQAVVANSYGYASFGSQTFRISDAVTSGSFGDWVFSKPLIDEVGESTATNGGLSGGTRQAHFEVQFDIASTQPNTQQPGLHVSVSPDRGDGSRMSYLRFEDGTTGLDVFFDDVQGATNPANFVETKIASGLNRKKVHAIKLTMNTLDGQSNDVVQVYIDGSLKHTGTSWENYYRFDTEAAPESTPRTVDSIIIQARGTATPADAGKGFLFDNINLTSGVLAGPPTLFKDCESNGWKTFNNPSFAKKNDCEKYVKDHQHTIKGNDVIYTANGLKREVDLDMSTAEDGSFEYDDSAKGWYNVKVSSVKVDGHFGWFAGKVVKASNPAWVNQWIFAKVEDNSPDKIWGSFTDMTSALNGVQAMSDPADGPFTVTKKDIKVK